MSERDPQPPAHAYWAVADVVPEDYWTKAPPKEGIRVEVMAYSDRKVTTWDCDVVTATSITNNLTAGFRIHSHRYVDRAAS